MDGSTLPTITLYRSSVAASTSGLPDLSGFC
jgi:hypothetical protein